MSSDITWFFAVVALRLLQLRETNRSNLLWPNTLGKSQIVGWVEERNPTFSVACWVSLSYSTLFAFAQPNLRSLWFLTLTQAYIMSYSK
jgi:hypothetical protein